MVLIKQVNQQRDFSIFVTYKNIVLEYEINGRTTIIVTLVMILDIYARNNVFFLNIMSKFSFNF